MSKSSFITIPKIEGTLECKNHRTICIMSQITKIILRVIINRVIRRTREQISEEQYGFMPGKGTSNAIFVMRNIMERMPNLSIS